MASPAVVSILLPARNAADTLPACLRSIQRQTFPAWECILVDDGSTDATASVLERFASHDERLRIVQAGDQPGDRAGRQSAPGGLVAALNRGLVECTGELVARMDADDVMHRQRLELQRATLANEPQLVAVGCHVHCFPTPALGRGMVDYQRWINSLRTANDVLRDRFVECPVVHPTLMFRREVLQDLCYRAEGWPEDYDLVLRILQDGDRIGMVPRRLLAWRHHPNRLQQVHPDYDVEQFVRCKAAFLVAGFLAEDQRYGLWGYGNTGRAIRRALQDHGRSPAYVVELHPGRLGNRIHGAEVVPPDRLPGLPRLPLLVSVAGTPARQAIRDHLDRLGWQELRDYVCVA